MNDYSMISELKGVGEKTKLLFHKLGIYTVGDLLRYYPRSYEIYEEPTLIGEVAEGRVVTITGAIVGKVQVGGRPDMQVTTIRVQDLTGTLQVVWFRMAFLRNTLRSGGVITLRGKVTNRKGIRVMEQPEIFYPSATYDEKIHTMQPNYSLTAGITNNTIVKAMRQALQHVHMQEDLLPEAVRLTYHLQEYRDAIWSIHFPKDKESYYIARKRFVFEEFLLFVLALRQMRETTEKNCNCFRFARQDEVEQFLKRLPFSLTNAQMRVWEEILADMNGNCVMSRLIQGDVGSGKTVIAFLGLMLAGINGYQGALMAPTEVLAKQHYETISEWIASYEIPLKICLLTGSMSAKEKRTAYEKIATGEADIIVGTHALIQDKVQYHSLALVVTDEQHRFGVKQREQLANKGEMPHILVMSATPIPRTLAMIVYGDLDISVIDELPANRLPIKNCVVDTGYREKAYRFMKNKVSLGRQCYVICPMIEENEKLEVENVVDYAKNLQEELGDDVRVEYLHGKMKQTEKDEIMYRFSKNEIQILVSTTVIEVGINVPNATVMMVENAERFGLAQLHQLRGRVGRGEHQSYCIFMSESKSKDTMERLSILNHSNDGFYIAGEDLKLRGPGDLFGIRQSGILNFKLGDVFQDAAILQEASEAAAQILKVDPQLKEDQHQYIAGYLRKVLNDGILPQL